jgi:hypothetical protein
MKPEQTLIPGLLVSLKTTLTGNVSYRVTDVDRRVTDSNAQVAVWETERTIADPVEYEAAKKVRSKARSLITSACIPSAFGLLCPERGADKLALMVREAQRIVAAFNSSAKLTRVGVFVITGRVAADDEQAIRAINSEMAELIERMQQGAANLDAAAIREAANKARAVSMMLTDSARERVAAAIDLARKEARRIVKAAETAALTVDSSVVSALAHSRTAFLEVDMPQADVAAPMVEARAVEFEQSNESVPSQTASVFSPQIETDVQFADESETD